MKLWVENVCALCGYLRMGVQLNRSVENKSFRTLRYVATYRMEGTGMLFFSYCNYFVNKYNYVFVGFL